MERLRWQETAKGFFHTSILSWLFIYLLQDLDKWQLQKRVTKYPTLLEFLGFA